MTLLVRSKYRNGLYCTIITLTPLPILLARHQRPARCFGAFQVIAVPGQYLTVLTPTTAAFTPNSRPAGAADRAQVGLLVRAGIASVGTGVGKRRGVRLS